MSTDMIRVRCSVEAEQVFDAVQLGLGGALEFAVEQAVADVVVQPRVADEVVALVVVVVHEQTPAHEPVDNAHLLI